MNLQAVLLVLVGMLMVVQVMAMVQITCLMVSIYILTHQLMMSLQSQFV